MHDNIENVTLTSETFGMEQYISDRLLEDFANVDNPVFTRTMDHLVVAIKVRIFGEQLEHKKIKSPKNWIQAFRERWLPEWWLEKHPVVYTRVEFDARFLYPSLKSNEQQFRAIKYVSLKFDGLEQGVNDSTYIA